MKNPVTILIVEDRANHIADCKAMLEVELLTLQIQVNVLWALDLEEALRLLPQADIIMTDVFFPSAQGMSDEEPNGKIVVEHCLAQSKPVVWVTSTYHHGNKTNAASDWGRERGLEMFDCPSAKEEEAPNKPWKCALYGLFCLAISLEDGDYTIFEGTIVWTESLREKGAEKVREKPSIYASSVHGSTVDGFFWRGQDKYESYYPAFRKMVDMGFPRKSPHISQAE